VSTKTKTASKSPARFAVVGPLSTRLPESYKKTIDRWLWPDLFRKQDTAVSQAKPAISDYKKAVGDPGGQRC